MAYKQQNFTKGMTLEADHLINIENAIIALEKNLPINYALPYTEWGWKDGLEDSTILKDSISLTNASGTAGIFGHIYTLANSPFEVGQTLYFGIKDLIKDGGNLSVVFLNGATEISRINATKIESPITYMTATIPENTTIMQIRFHGNSWTSITAGKFYISTIEFDENTVFNSYTPSTSTESSIGGEKEYVYVSTSGNDSNTGTYGSPFKTLNGALAKSSNVVIMGGIYPGELVEISNYSYPKINIKGIEGQRVIFNFGTNILVNDGSEILVDGYTKVYKVALATNPYNNTARSVRIYQDYVDDVSTLISDADRLPHQRGRIYRCDSTIIKRVYNTTSNIYFDDYRTALNQIETMGDNQYGWYWWDGYLYFSRPQVSSAEHPIILPKQDARLISCAMTRSQKNQVTLNLNNIEVRYGNVHLGYVANSEIADVLVKYPYVSNGGCFYLYCTSNTRLYHCEAASVTNGEATGDGFNVDTPGDANINTNCMSLYMDSWWSHDNNDDGYSDHDNSDVTIVNSLFEYCGKGGLTPAYGSNDIYDNCICRYNTGGGINVTGNPTTGRKWTSVVANNCLCYGNKYGFWASSSECKIECINCTAHSNSTADYHGTGQIYAHNCFGGSGTKKTGNVTVYTANQLS